MADYIAKRKVLVESGKLSQATLLIEGVTHDCLIDFFGAETRLRDISEGSVEDFRNWLLSAGGRPVKRCGPETVVRSRTPLAEATTRKRCSIAGKFFRYAMRHGLVSRNPFEAVPKANIPTKRRAYIQADDARKILAELPTSEWRLLFALSRWGGLRVGSEVRRLTWDDVDWKRRRILIHAPKTEHHAGHETRSLPIFPELAPLLDERYDEAAEGEALVLPMLQGRTDSALRNTLIRAITRVGLNVWPRL